MKFGNLSLVTAGALLCSAGAANAVSLDFTSSTVSGSLPTGLLYSNVTATGPAVDLLVTAGSNYSNSFVQAPSPDRPNGNANGITPFDFGQIGLDDNLEVDFNFQFLAGGTNTPIALSEIVLSLVDLDGTNAAGSAPEFVQTPTPAAFLAGSALTITPGAPGGGTRFTGVPNEVPNPTSPVLSFDQSGVALELTFQNTSAADFIFFAGDNGTRFFNFGGELVFDPGNPPTPGTTEVIPFEVETSLGLLAVGGLFAGRQVLRRKRRNSLEG